MTAATELEQVLADLRAAVHADAAPRPGTRLLRYRRARSRIVVAGIAAAVFAGGGAAVAVGTDLLAQQERFHAAAPDDPRRLGPLVEITSGVGWSLIAWRSEYGLCLDFAIPGNSPFTCGLPVRGASAPPETVGALHEVAGFVSGGGLVGGDGKTTILGIAAADVAAVEVELRDGTVVDAGLHRAPPALGVDVRFFVARLELEPPQGGATLEAAVRAYLAYDGDGRLIEQARA